MKVTYQLQLTDWQAADRFVAAKRPRPTVRERLQTWFFFLLVGSVFVVPTIAIPINYLQSPPFQAAWKVRGLAALVPISFVLIPISFFALLWFGAPLLRGYSFRQSPFHQRQMTLSLEQNGVQGENLVPWSKIHSVEESADHIFIRFGDNRYFLIPRRAFESNFAATQFATKVRDAVNNAAD